MRSDTDLTLLLNGTNDTLIWGMSNTERLTRLMKKMEGELCGFLWADLGYVFDPQWIRHMQDNADSVLTIGGVPILAHLISQADATELAAGRVPKGLKAIEYEDGPEIHNHGLRKLDTPFARALTPATVRDIERQSYFGAYKGVTDILTKYLWPELALVLTRWAAKVGMTPNMVTSIGAIGCIAAIFLFYYGYFWSGMASGFVFMVLDTVDGKLARCTITSSYWGNIFDHGLDLVHPPFWWVAWAFGLYAAGMPLTQDQLIFALGVILGGYILQRLIEGAFILAFDQHIHVWRPIDSWFRLITARRNPNMVILFVAMIFNRPDLGLLALAWWTLISLLVHMLQLAQAGIVKMRGGKIVSWLDTVEG